VWGEPVPFGYFQTDTANWNFARKKAQPRGAERAARLGFEGAFWAKRKRIYQWRAKEIFSYNFFENGNSKGFLFWFDISPNLMLDF